MTRSPRWRQRSRPCSRSGRRDGEPRAAGARRAVRGELRDRGRRPAATAPARLPVVRPEPPDGRARVPAHRVGDGRDRGVGRAGRARPRNGMDRARADDRRRVRPRRRAVAPSARGSGPRRRAANRRLHWSTPQAASRPAACVHAARRRAPARGRARPAPRSAATAAPTSKGVEAIDDVAYGAHVRQRLDILRPRVREGRAPVLIHVHGGSWTGGRQRARAGRSVHTSRARDGSASRRGIA